MATLTLKLHVACMLLAIAVLPSPAQPMAAPGPETEQSSLSVLGTNTPCRIIPLTTNCGLPLYLGNHRCDIGVKIGRPTSVEQMQAMVTMFPRVKGSGVGHSWNQPFFCSGNNSNAINIITTEIEPTLKFIENPVDPVRWVSEPIPPDFPILVDEDAGTVTVAAGITQRHLLEYLAAYTHEKQPYGWTLPAFSWFVDQTIAGAVATATHGSTLQWGSLSSQVRGMKVVLANGTLLELASPDENEHLWKALGTSVGRLGIVTEVTLRIVPAAPVTRTSHNITYNQFVDDLMIVQEEYKRAKAANDTDGMKEALSKIDESETFWVAPTGNMFRADFTYPEKGGPGNVTLNLTIPMVTKMEGPSTEASASVYDQVLRPRVPDNAFELDNENAYYLGLGGEVALEYYMTNGTFPRDKAFLASTAADSQVLDVTAPFDQYEVAVPLERSADCLKIIGDAVYGPEELWKGFRTANNIRFISGEPFYLSPAHGGPVMYLNLEDYIQPSGGGDNTKFDKVIDIFLKQCGARFHWGKAGWPKHMQCFDGAAYYPDSWCDFGCAVHQLDPGGKFHSLSNVWEWKATINGGEVEYGSCCTPQGFDKARCSCASVNPCGPQQPPVAAATAVGGK